MKYKTLQNNQTFPLHEMPILAYNDFLELNTTFLNSVSNHCVNYYGLMLNKRMRLICCIADDAEKQIYLSTSELDLEMNGPLASFTARNFAFHIFERELHENFGIQYEDHPWLKPVRYAFNRHNSNNTIDNYPFYQIHSDELHQVAVGPIHAGIIEPGHFRFICNGEQILHLEIQLGYQHRGIEALFLREQKLLQRTVLAESIAGDSVVGHTTAFVSIWERLTGFQPSKRLELERTIALEMERLTIHVGDLSGICSDIGYQLGTAVFGRLRTPVINFIQEWCGNRLSKGLIRAEKSNYPLTDELVERLIHLLDVFEPDFVEMFNELKALPTVLARLEKTGILTTEQAEMIGAVGMVARTSGIARDIRRSHPSGPYKSFYHMPVVKHYGDVMSRVQIRNEEILQSIKYLRQWLEGISTAQTTFSPAGQTPAGNSFTISLIEGWRGEICHCAITDASGKLFHYKIKDPSFHNWLAVALAVRYNEISDFPVCNKSFNLSYAGHDL